MDQGDSEDDQEQPQFNPSDVQRNSALDVTALSEISNSLIGIYQQLDP